MSNEPIKPIEQNYVPYKTLFPNAVIGGVEVDDSISSPTKTWSSEKINTEIGNIDLSPYEKIDNKNIAGGYLGLDDIGRIDSIFKVVQKNKLGFYINFLNYFFNSNNSGLRSVSVAGGGVYSNIGTNAVKLKPTLTNPWGLPTLYLGANSTGSVTCDHGAINIRLDTTSKIQGECYITAKLSAKQSRLVFGLGTFSSSSSSLSGNGVLFVIDPTANSGNFQCGKIVSDSFTPNNLDISLTNETAIKLRIHYNKSTEMATFYINDVLVYTLNSVNIATSTVFSLIYGMSTADNTDATIRAMSIASHALEVEL